MRTPAPLALALLALAAARPAAAQGTAIHDSGGPLLPEQAAFDVEFYDLALRVDPAARGIAGTGTTVARIVSPTRHLVLDLDTTFAVSAVTGAGGGLPLRWERRGGRLRIDLGAVRAPGERVSARVAYAGRPRVAPRAPWDGGWVWARTPSGAPWIATAVQGEGADVWWPVKDHVSDKPDSMSIRVTVPEPLVAASNGRLRGTECGRDGTRTYHWFVSTPISAYNVALNVAPYRTVEGELESVAGGRFPVVFYVLPEDEERGRAFFPEILDHLRFFEELLGPYPFRADKYGVAQTPHLGMEHQTIVAYGAAFDNAAMTGRDWGFDALHHHELAHEWWGNLVTVADWKDMWLHEGFGTYMQALYMERRAGKRGYHAYLAAQREGIANAGPVAPREPRTAGQIYFDTGGDIYAKGAWFLHTLRWTVGDPAFFRSLRRMAYPDPALERVTDGRQTRFATTDDFLRIAEREAGRELGWLFEVYLRQAALPRLVVERAGGRVALRWEAPGGLPFPLPVEVEVDGVRRRVEMPGGRGELRAPAGARVVVDPESWTLREAQAPVAPAAR